MSHDDRLPDPARVVLKRRIEWMDTDAAGIYHWTTAFRLAEAAEAAMHTALNCAVSASFTNALRFNDLVDVALAVEAIGRTSVQYRLTITADAGPAVDGSLKACLIDRSTGRATPWPADIRERLAAGGLQQTDR